MDATTRKRKLDERATWSNNLAILKGQAARYGMTPPLDLVNEIETAERNIKRVEDELDAGTETSSEQSLISMFELLLVLSRRIDDIRLQLKTIRRTTNLSRQALISRWSAIGVCASVYTSIMIKEIRDVIIANPLAAALIIVLFLVLAGLLFLLSTLLHGPEEGP